MAPNPYQAAAYPVQKGVGVFTPWPRAPLKPVHAADPAGALAGTGPDAIAQYVASLAPDYTHVQPVDLAAIRRQAHTAAAQELAPFQNNYDFQQGVLDRQKTNSQQAATSFTQALTEMLQGGQTGQAGMDYAHERYGGSYLGAVAGQMGAQLFSEVTRDFDQQSFKLADQLAQVMSKSAAIEQDIYGQLANDARDAQAQQIKLADTSLSTRIKAAAVLLKQANEDRKFGLAAAKAQATGSPTVRNFSDGTTRQYNDQTGVWDVVTAKQLAAQGIPKAPTTRAFKDGTTRQWDGSKWVIVASASGGNNHVPSGLTRSQSVKAAGKIAQEAIGNGPTVYQTDPVTGKKVAGKVHLNYQEAIKEALSQGVALADIQKALGTYWKRGEVKPWEVGPDGKTLPGGGRPKKSFQERNQGKTAKNASLTTTYSGGGGTGLVGLLQQAGFTGEGLRIAYGIVMRESHGNPQAFNGNTQTGDRSWGLFQINTLGTMKSRVKKFGLQSEQQLLDPLANAKAAYQMSSGGTDFGAWGIGPNAYRTGAGMDTIRQYYDAFPGAV